MEPIMFTRPTWDEYWMQVAQVISTRSTCIRRQIGCVITLDNLIISSGYNGSCRKLENCSDTQICLRDVQQIPSGTQLQIDHGAHAEQNALLNLPFNLKQYTLKSQCAVYQTPKPTMYVTTYPCPICAKLLIQAGIRRVVCYSAYSNQDAIELLAQAGVEVCWTNS